MDRGNVRFWDGREMNLSIIFLVALQLTEYVCVLHEYPATCFAYVLLGSTLLSKRRTVHMQASACINTMPLEDLELRRDIPLYIVFIRVISAIILTFNH